uniref:Uncharacterized protein n=1 Tax=Romanomermis culicivorax TaxID=13658 RepID=A0A915K9P2_ROMCU
MVCSLNLGEWRTKFENSLKLDAIVPPQLCFTKSFYGALENSALANITFCIWRMIKISSAWENHSFFYNFYENFPTYNDERLKHAELYENYAECYGYLK